MNIQQLEQKYKELTAPPNFVNLFKDYNEFREWCNSGSVEDLKHTLCEFEKHEEVYEYCAIILEVIEDKGI